jgi:glucose-6-phosphate isomerase
VVYQQEIASCLAETIGSGGLPRAALARWLAAALEARDQMIKAPVAAETAFLAAPDESTDLPTPNSSFTRLLVFGTGGSSLGGQALCALASAVGRGLSVAFVETIEPAAFEALLAARPWRETAVLAISKSGNTTETVMQTLLALEAAEGVLGRAALAQHFRFLAGPGPHPLTRLAAHYAIPCSPHDPALGGRYAALSAVGLLPARACGLDLEAIRRGARQVREATLNSPTGLEQAAPPLIGAALVAGLMRERGIGIAVFFHYLERLAPFARWLCQLWAESLGKDGEAATPLAARGPTDQHSQLQLYLAGAADKMITLLTLRSAEPGRQISRPLAEQAGAGYLAGHSLGGLLAIQAEATAVALAETSRPARRLILGAFDEETMGALMMHFQLEVVLIGRLLGLDPFDQPAVERSKMQARRMLGWAD